MFYLWVNYPIPVYYQKEMVALETRRVFIGPPGIYLFSVFMSTQNFASNGPKIFCQFFCLIAMS